jgi:hypothetical protein
VASATVSGLDRQPATLAGLSLSGAFHLVLTIAAARENDRTQAYAYLDQAHDNIDLATARDLLQLSGSRVRPELRELAERFGTAS